MKKFWNKKTPFWAVIALVVVTTATVGFIGNVKASGEKQWWTTVEYVLVQDLDLDAPNDDIVILGKPAKDFMSIQTGKDYVGGSWKPRCGSKLDDMGDATNDTFFPAANQHYYGGFAIALSRNNSKEGRVPKNFFIKSDESKHPGKKMKDLWLQTDAYNDGICYHFDSNTNETWTMRKYRVGMD